MLNNLPTEIIIHCCQYLDNKSIFNLKNTNSYLKNIILNNQNEIYKNGLLYHFGKWTINNTTLFKIMSYEKINSDIGFLTNILQNNIEILLSTLIHKYEYHGIKLLMHIGINIETYIGTILKSIIQLNDLSKLQFLSQLNLKFSEITDDNNNTPFMMCMYSLLADDVTKRYLLYNLKVLTPQNVNVISRTGKTVLNLCIDNLRYTSSEFIDFVLDLNPDLNYNGSFLNSIQNCLDETLLFKMLNSNVNLNYQNIEGITPLMMALESNSITYSYISENFLLRLLEKDMDINIKNNYNETALVYICKFSNLNITEKVLDKFFNKNPDITVKDTDGNTPLHIAIYYLKYKVQIYNYCLFNNDTLYIMEILINMLLDRTTNLNIQNKLGETPLMIALKSSSVKLSTEILRKMLTDFDFDINLQDIQGNTVTIYALQQYIYEYTTKSINTDLQECIQLLLEKKPDIFLTNNFNNSIFSLCTSHINLLPKSIYDKIVF